jgi:hypothetical protein
MKEPPPNIAATINEFLTLSSLKPSSARTFGIRIKTTTESRTAICKKITAPTANNLDDLYQEYLSRRYLTELLSQYTK